jgi:CTP synthase (UTP-ammonia lyase)
LLKAGGGDNERVVDALLTAPLKKRAGEEGRDGGHVMSRSMVDWARMAFKLDQFVYKVRIVIVGKYTGLQDFYLSVIKSLKVREDDLFLFSLFFECRIFCYFSRTL